MNYPEVAAVPRQPQFYQQPMSHMVPQVQMAQMGHPLQPMMQIPSLQQQFHVQHGSTAPLAYPIELQLLPPRLITAGSKIPSPYENKGALSSQMMKISGLECNREELTEKQGHGIIEQPGGLKTGEKERRRNENAAPAFVPLQVNRAHLSAVSSPITPKTNADTKVWHSYLIYFRLWHFSNWLLSVPLLTPHLVVIDLRMRH